MRIVATADIHCGITSADAIERLGEEIARQRPDVVVAAGDIGEPLKFLALGLDLLGKPLRDIPKLMVAGNHDIWHREGNHSSRELWEGQISKAAEDNGWIHLEKDNWKNGSVAICGTMGWYDYSAADPHLDRTPAAFRLQKAKYVTDAAYIDWPWGDEEFARELQEDLVGRLEQVQNDPAVKMVVVVTHIPAFESQMCRKPGDERWGFSNAYFGNLTMGESIRGFPKVRHVISGHTHTQPTARPAADMPFRTHVVPSDYRVPAFVTIDVS